MRRKGYINNQRGVALIVVLLIISILIAFAVELNRSSRNAIYDAANISDGIKLTHIAKSGFYASAALLVSNISQNCVSLNDAWAKTETLTEKSHSLFPDGFFLVKIEDESGKIPINKLVNGNEFNPDIRDIMIRLLSQPEFGLDEQKAMELVEAIKDWIDIDDTITGAEGAESPYYATLTPPYAAKNSPLDCVEELPMIKGVSKNIYAGTKERPGLAQYVTVHGDGFININTAPQLVLRSLSPDISADIASKMDEYRNNTGNDLSSVLWYQQVPGLAGTTIKQGLITVKSNYFKISSTGKLGNMEQKINAVIKISDDRKSFQILNWRTG